MNGNRNSLRGTRAAGTGEKKENRRKAILILFGILALGNLPTLFRNPLEYLGALILCFLLSVALVRILY